MSDQEVILRNNVRKVIKKFFHNNLHSNVSNKLFNQVIEEHKLRMQLRHIILEAASEDPTVDAHDNTGISTLKDLLKNTNILSTLRNVYKTLTTDDLQRKSFRSHVIKWIEDTLAPVEMNDKAPELNEIIDDGAVDIDVTDSDRGKFIDADDGSPTEEPAVGDEDNEMSPLQGEDTTGRNKAERVYPSIEKSIVDYYGELGNDEDQELFYDYLIANTKLYFDKWESELSTNVEEPTNDAYDSVSQAAAE